MIDRRMITTFLIQYANTSSSKEVKLQMLDAMSKILLFGEEERSVLGLAKRKDLP